MNDFMQNYKEKTDIIDSYMSNRFKEFENCEDVLLEAMRYSVFNGGKRIRSVLCIETAKMLTGSIDKALPFAMAIELIHAFSLIHDDLPSMDNSDTRRGLPSCHKKFGEAMALLAGDALLNTAYEIMAAECEKSGTGAVKAMRHISKSAGVSGMINGQVRDLKLSAGKNADEESLIALIEQKTMAMIMTGVISAALLSDADEKDISQLEEFAYNVGIAFQIRDDFEDEAEDAESAQNSPNFINTLGSDKAREKMIFCKNKALNVIDGYENNEFLKSLVEYLF